MLCLLGNLAWSHAGASVRTADRSRAERARGLMASSRSEAATGFLTCPKLGAGPLTASGRWREPAGVAPLRLLRKRLTMRSSRLWKVTTASRPPGASARSAARSPCSSSSSSAFKWIRIAWKVRVAGSLFWPWRKPKALRTTAASSAVRVSGRAATIARATERARGSSPYSLMTRAISASSPSLRNSAAVMPGLRHAHVERAVGLEREAAVGAVELHRRHADVERDAVDRADAARGEHAVHLAEIFLDQGQRSGVRDE